ncbi:MAG: hypothetical protein P9M15_05910 [Candidatus Electryoneaceae bacterium]|nr:hypothetical protein [Candidatus Electryoneaceae bacterium]
MAGAFLSSGDDAVIGAVFTPRKWTEWLINRYNIVDGWLGGSSVLDPTCGKGEFLAALVRIALSQGVPEQSLPLNRLFGIEREEQYLNDFRCHFQAEFGFDFPTDNLICADIILQTVPIRADILIGNPPWCNFADLPDDYKEMIKPAYIDYNLVRDKRNLLLGGSRIDIAALVIAKTIRYNLRSDGGAYYYIPLSLLLNDGAHSEFRRFQVESVEYMLNEFYDFDGIDAFPDVATRYGTAHFTRDKRQTFPIPCYRREKNLWEKHYALPIFGRNDAFSVVDTKHSIELLKNFPKIPLPAKYKPRQGVNTCGSNRLLIFTDYRKINESLADVECRQFGRVKLPSRFLYPLLDNLNFDHSKERPVRYILLPYDESTGKPLSMANLMAFPELISYLHRIEVLLKARRGKFIGSWIERGLWWACLGVGRYSFMPYKVIWKAYGSSHFKPQIYGRYNGKSWQGNQALHAYIPCESECEAEDIRKELLAPEVDAYLRSFRMDGTRNWAQPGKVMKLLQLL